MKSKRVQFRSLVRRVPRPLRILLTLAAFILAIWQWGMYDAFRIKGPLFLRGAIERYTKEHGELPASVQDLDQLAYPQDLFGWMRVEFKRIDAHHLSVSYNAWPLPLITSRRGWTVSPSVNIPLSSKLDERDLAFKEVESRLVWKP